MREQLAVYRPGAEIVQVTRAMREMKVAMIAPTEMRGMRETRAMKGLSKEMRATVVVGMETQHLVLVLTVMRVTKAMREMRVTRDQMKVTRVVWPQVGPQARLLTTMTGMRATRAMKVVTLRAPHPPLHQVPMTVTKGTRVTREMKVVMLQAPHPPLHLVTTMAMKAMRAMKVCASTQLPWPAMCLESFLLLH